VVPCDSAAFLLKTVNCINLQPEIILSDALHHFPIFAFYTHISHGVAYKGRPTIHCVSEKKVIFSREVQMYVPWGTTEGTAEPYHNPLLMVWSSD